MWKKGNEVHVDDVIQFVVFQRFARGFSLVLKAFMTY